MSTTPIVQPAPELQVSAGTANGRTTLRCTGRLISSTTDYFTAEVKRLLQRSNILVVNLEGLTYMDSAGLGSLVGALSSARHANCEFRLVNVTPRIMELLRITNIVKVLQPTNENLL